MYSILTEIVYKHASEVKVTPLKIAQIQVTFYRNLFDAYEASWGPFVVEIPYIYIEISFSDSFDQHKK